MAERTAREVRARLSRFHHCTEPPDDPRYTGVPEWLLLHEVPVATTRYRGIDVGVRTGVRQRIDSVAVGLWSKRTGNEVRGYEIKVSRADLLAELRDPGKAAAGAACCDSWWLALGDPSLLKDSDPLPEAWGVIACSGSGMRVLKPAVQAVGALSGSFVAGLLQAGLRSSTYRRANGYAAGWQAGLRQGQRMGRVQYLPRDVFEAVSGA